MTGIKRQGEPPTREEIRAVVERLKQARDFGAHLIEQVGVLLDALQELERIREAMKRDSVPINWIEYLGGLESNEPLVHALKSSTVQTFDLGKLEIQVADPQLRAFINLCKGRLERDLSKKYGAKFNVKVTQPIDPTKE